jgi:hypothetical protein
LAAARAAALGLGGFRIAFRKRSPASSYSVPVIIDLRLIAGHEPPGTGPPDFHNNVGSLDLSRLWLLDDQRLWRKDLNMVIISVDYRPSDQYIAFVDSETGECGER